MDDHFLQLPLLWTTYTFVFSIAGNTSVSNRTARFVLVSKQHYLFSVAFVKEHYFSVLKYCRQELTSDF